MNPSLVALYRCPADGSMLRLDGDALVSPAGRRHLVEDGIPNLIHPNPLPALEADTRAEYDRVADDIYDRAVDWQFKAFLEDEDQVRESMVDLLDPRPGMTVLEIGCGTGRDSFRLARRLGDAGALHMQDLSPRMVAVCREHMKRHRAAIGFGCALEYSASNAACLPYPDDAFDAVFHFGGFNHFGDLKKAAAELARVTRPGGRVVFGDEAVAPWLKGTEFDGIVSTNNALFKAEIPLACLPALARDVTVRWVIANCFYVIAFTKGDGPPKLDLDLPHTGIRGGSLRSRYFGVLEGVSPEAKAMVRQAASHAGVSIHDWLDARLREAAGRELGQ